MKILPLIYNLVNTKMELPIQNIKIKCYDQKFFATYYK